MGFDFDITLPTLEDLGFLFPKEGIVISGRPLKGESLIKLILNEMGLGQYEVFMNPFTITGYDKDSAAVHKAKTITREGIKEFYDDSEYQLRIISRLLEKDNYKCRLKKVSKSGIQDFKLRKWTNT